MNTQKVLRTASVCEPHTRRALACNLFIDTTMEHAAMPIASDKPRFVPALRFHWLTPLYDAVVRWTVRERHFKQALLVQAAVQPGFEVLDLACGTGTLALWLAQQAPAARIAGIDADPRVLTIARRKANAAGVVIDFREGRSVALPYPDACFDRVLSTLFFHHLCWADKERTARELHRVLRPGGELHVADWGKATGPFSRAAFLAVQLLDGFANTRDNVRGRLIELFNDAGFAQVAEQQAIITPFGRLSLYRATKA